MMKIRLTLAGLLLVGFALRLVGVVADSPPGVAHDEVAHWLIARSILDKGNHAVYFTEAYGHEAGYHYVEAIFLFLLGDNLLALRLPAVFSGLLGAAVTCALAKRLFGARVALLSMGLMTVLFWPVFYSRLALRAISLPVAAGLSALFWWRGWQAAGGRPSLYRPFTLSPVHWLMLAGLCAGLSLYTYLAARAVPIFYVLFIVYLALFHWRELKQRWRGVAGFTAVFLLTAFPLFYFLQTHPGAEFRVAEVSAPLQALLRGDPIPVLQNGMKLAGMFGLVGDPLWREGVPDIPVFEPVLALLFYGGVLASLWRWRDGRYAFLLLWLFVSLIPSLVTINAPSHIRAINALLVITIFPANLIHNLCELSTDFPRLSTKWAKLALTILTFTFFLLYGARTAHLLFNIWPGGGDVPFVWQAAFAETAARLDSNNSGELKGVALAGWTPETMDVPSMALLRRRDDRPISHFNPQEGTLIIPESGHIIRPSVLPLHPIWEDRVVQLHAAITTGDLTTQYTLPTPLPVTYQFPTNISFAHEVNLLGYEFAYSLPSHSPSHSPSPTTAPAAPALLTYWQVTAVPPAARRLFIHFLDADGNLLADAYAFDTADPQSLWFPHWQPGDLIWQHHELPVPATDVATIRLGWFDPYTCHPGPCYNLQTEEGEAFFWLPVNGNP